MNVSKSHAQMAAPNTLTCGARPEKVDSQYGTTGDEYQSTLTLCFPDVALKQLLALHVGALTHADHRRTLLCARIVEVEVDDLRDGLRVVDRRADGESNHTCNEVPSRASRLGEFLQEWCAFLGRGWPDRLLDGGEKPDEFVLSIYK